MIQQITVLELQRRLAAGEPTYLLDVRLPWEHDVAHLAEDALVPLQELQERFDEVQPPAGALVVCFCHHGVRSLHAAAFLQGQGVGPVASLQGGIEAWSSEVDPAVPRY